MMKKSYRNYIIIIFLLTPLLPVKFSYSQNQNKIDSLIDILKNETNNENKINTLNVLSRELFYIGNYVDGEFYAKQAVEASKILLIANNKVKQISNGLADAYNTLGNINLFQGNYNYALKYYTDALNIFEEYEEKGSVAKVLGNIGSIYSDQGDYLSALSYYLKSLKLSEELKEKNIIASSQSNIGNVYRIQGELQKALEYYNKSLILFNEMNNKNGISASIGNIGVIYLDMAAKEIDSTTRRGLLNIALEYCNEAIKIDEELNNKSGISVTLGDVGNIYNMMNNYDSAIFYYSQAIKIDEQLNNKSGIARHLVNIGVTNRKIGDNITAEKFLKKGYEIAESINYLEALKEVSQELSNIYKIKGNYRLALEYFDKYNAIKDSLKNEEIIKSQTRLELQYEFDKKEAEAKAEQDKKDALAQAESQRQQTIIYSVAAGFILVLVFAGFIFRSLRVTKKQKHIIELQKNEVLHQKHEAEKQKELVEEKQKEIIDSITYAKRLQQAILPPEDLIKQYLPDSFLLYKPKDIVAGDFYWMEAVTYHPTLPETSTLPGKEQNNHPGSVSHPSFSGGEPKSSPPEKGESPKEEGVMNLPSLKHFRKELRNNLTPAEAKLWTLLNGKKLDDRKFRRQHSVGPYILDFYCPSEELAIELDGEAHNNVVKQEYDHERDLFVQNYGIKVLRFENKAVFENPEMLLEAIRQEFGWKKNYLSEASKQNNHPGSVSHPSFAGGESQSSPPEKGESPKEEGVTIFIAAADCTGHGVPGAMVSVVCSNALNRAVKEFELRNTGKILDKVTDLVLETFEKSASDVKDGMDISLLKIDFLQNQEGNLIPDCIEWSGANNPLWYSQNQEMQEITADKQPIGKNDNRKPFTTHYINCKPQNTERYFYLFTDGYADQFGGEKGKKFKYKPFKELLLSINKNPMEKQKTIISETIVNWKGDLEQVDDICVIGIKI